MIDVPTEPDDVFYCLVSAARGYRILRHVGRRYQLLLRRAERQGGHRLYALNVATFMGNGLSHDSTDRAPVTSSAHRWRSVAGDDRLLELSDG